MTKAAVVEAVWGTRAVSDVVLMVCIRELRQALGEDGETGRFIETVHRRGYRFVGLVSADARHGPSHRILMPRRVTVAAPGVAATVVPVGRETELAWLHRHLAAARRGVRQVVFVTGEAGLGKTALVNAFLAAVETDEDLCIAVGQCIEHHGPAEAYLPILEALGRLGQTRGRDFAALLARYAPTWVTQLPALSAELASVPAPVPSATSVRMLRELAEALEALTSETPLVLVLEDLHWSDYSTVDFIASLARRRGPARLLLIGIYRPGDALRAGHPLHVVKHELLAHGHGDELALAFWSEAPLADYLATHLPGLERLHDVARIVHRRTDGNPLFTVNVLASWRTLGWLSEADGRWLISADLDQLMRGIPATLREMVEHQVDGLSRTDQRTLEAASVAGVEFSATDVAAALEQEISDIEDACAELARRQQFLQQSGEIVWPDGTVAAGYRFLHALYQEIIYDRTPPARRAELHRRIGAREELGYATRLDECAAALAVHFERGRQPERAIMYRRRAAATALRRHAYADAVGHLAHTLTLIKSAGAADSLRQELEVQMALGPALMATRGYGAPQVEQTYRRARELCRELADTASLGPVLVGLRRVYTLQGRLADARKLGEECLVLAQRSPALALETHLGLAVTLCFQGKFAESRTHATQGWRLYDTERRDTHPPGQAGDPGVGCLAYEGLVLWFLGHSKQARAKICAAVALADRLADPFSQAYALIAAAWFHQFSGDARTTLARAEAAVALSQTHGFPLREAQGAILAGWAQAMSGQPDVGLLRIRQGLESFRATGSALNLTYYLALFAEAHEKCGQVDEALGVLGEAFALLTQGGECWWEAELYRFRGVLRSRHASESTKGAAKRDLRRALLVARRQHARSLELRAASSLATLVHDGRCRAGGSTRRSDRRAARSSRR
jgi:predicted ATPase